MSIFNRKGHRAIPARDPQTGAVHTVPAKIDSGIDRRSRYVRDKNIKGAKASNREFKKHLRDFKKQYPPEQRAKINWSNPPDINNVVG